MNYVNNFVSYFSQIWQKIPDLLKNGYDKLHQMIAQDNTVYNQPISSDKILFVYIICEQSSTQSIENELVSNPSFKFKYIGHEYLIRNSPNKNIDLVLYGILFFYLIYITFL